MRQSAKRKLIISALYGKPYIRAAKDTWNLFQDRGEQACRLSFVPITQFISHLQVSMHLSTIRSSALVGRTSFWVYDLGLTLGKL